LAQVQATYNHPRVITRDEMPGWGNVTVPANLATARPVSASSTEAGANVAANAVDGSYSTRWSSLYTDAQWLSVDLGANYNVNRVKITWEAAYGRDYTVQYSTDGTNWSTARSIVGNTSLVNDHTGLTGTARYVRMNGTARGTVYGYSIFALEVYGTPATSVNQAPSVSVTAPSNNASYTSPASINITANATDSDGSISKVDFYNGSTLLTNDFTAPFEFSWTNVAAGTYTITARATDNSGAGTTSSAITVVVNNPVVNPPATSSTKVVAYVANWNDLNVYSNNIDYAKLTHINIAFENPNSNGDLSFNSGNAALIQRARANNVKVFLSIGGGAVDDNLRNTYFSLISDTRRAGFVAKIAAYIQARNFDGLDVDLEGPAINGDYGKFIADLAAALKPAGKGLTAALSQGYGGGNVPASTFQHFDFINIMAYDATGPWAPNSPGQHSSYAFAQSNLQYWLGRGLPKSKAVLGLPFYGYGFGSAAGEWSYNRVVSTFAGAENVDQAGSTVWYNGIPTIKAKVNYAFDQDIAGVMIWELSQDAPGARSLLLAIDQVVKLRGVVTPVPANLATGKPVTASSTEAGANTAANAVDGQYGTRWSSLYSDAQSLTVDLGAVYAVNRVKITWEAAYGRDYTVQYSTDGTSWSTARAVTGNTSLMNDHTGLTGTARYVRMNGTARGTAFGYSIFELEVYGDIPVPSNLATGKPVTVSSTEVGANVAANAVDGQYGTRWSSLYTDAQWLTVDLGANYNVNRVKITWEAAYGRDYRVVGSLDGVTWTTLRTITGNTALMNDHTGLTGTYRYISMNGTARGTAFGYSIFELEVYGSAAGNTNQLPTVSLTSPATNATATAPASIVISANASDSDGSVTKVDFYNGTTLLNSDATAPYSFTWTNVAAGSYTITARATDNAGAVSSSSASVVTVTNVVIVNTPPSVTLTSPSANTSFNAPATITISANASDSDGSITKVDFYNGTTLLTNDFTAPYTFTWSNVAAGTYTITARATDNSGAGTTSSAVTVTVVNVVSNVCSSIPQYTENGGYGPGSRVRNNGRQYECRPFPFSGWCNGAAWAYGPGTGAYSADAWVDRGSCTARSTTDESSQAASVALSVSPNPATDVITINTDLASKVRIFNAQGMEVMNETSVQANGTVNISDLVSGIYYVRIDTGNELVTKTIIKK
jgi:GH18 family chitinase